MELQIYQVDAFASEQFKGTLPGYVLPKRHWKKA